MSLGLFDSILVFGEKKRLHSEVDDVTKAAKTVVYRAPFRDGLSNSPAEGVVGSGIVARYKPQPVSETIPLHCLNHMLSDLLATMAGFELRKGNESLAQF